MHHYLIDDRATNNAPTGRIEKVRSWVKASQIAGEQHVLKSPQQIIEQIQKILHNSSTKPTIVVIGDDFSLDIAISSLSEDQRSTAIGYVPLQSGSASSLLLGYKDWKQACGALLRAKREALTVIKVEDYTVLSKCLLKPQTASDSLNNEDLFVKLDRNLEIQLPAAHMEIENLSNQEHLQVKPRALEITGSLPSAALLHSQKGAAILPFRSSIAGAKRQEVFKLKANYIKITTTSPLLLQGIVQLRPDFTVQKITTPQQFIVQTKNKALHE